jgi:hypothetical protein
MLRKVKSYYWLLFGVISYSPHWQIVTSEVVLKCYVQVTLLQVVAQKMNKLRFNLM